MYDIAVVGGGLVGAAFALDLARQNTIVKIILIERNQPDFSHNEQGYDNKIYALSPKNYQHIQAMTSLLDEKRVGVIEAMDVRGNHGGKIEFDQHDCRGNYLAKIVEYRNLHQAVYRELSNHDNVEFKFTSLAKIENGAEQVSLYDTDGSKLDARWLIAADGANSFVRQQIGFDLKEIPYYQSGVVANFRCEHDHHNIARQWFLGEGILAYLPLPNQQISIVWSSNEPDALLQLSADELCSVVAEAGQYSLGKLELITSAQAFPLKLNLIEKFYSERVILIGDAAHTIHPLAGQGVNLGFGDAWELALLLAKNANNLSIAELARYNYNRLAEVRKMQMTCHMLHRLFHNRLPVVDKLRNLGLNLINQISPLKKVLINSAINY
ncbi:MAG: FAD-dependent oxidoreductase [Neisseriaceae bacterium]|nr:MAG: FAD-dependent oxidoreductase [Neisseriaceae bacterium]